MVPSVLFFIALLVAFLPESSGLNSAKPEDGAGSDPETGGDPIGLHLLNLRDPLRELRDRRNDKEIDARGQEFDQVSKRAAPSDSDTLTIGNVKQASGGIGYSVEFWQGQGQGQGQRAANLIEQKKGQNVEEKREKKREVGAEEGAEEGGAVQQKRQGEEAEVWKDQGQRTVLSEPMPQPGVLPIGQENGNVVEIIQRPAEVGTIREPNRAHPTRSSSSSSSSEEEDGKGDDQQMKDGIHGQQNTEQQTTNDHQTGQIMAEPTKANDTNEEIPELPGTDGSRVVQSWAQFLSRTVQEQQKQKAKDTVKNTRGDEQDQQKAQEHVTYEGLDMEELSWQFGAAVLAFLVVATAFACVRATRKDKMAEQKKREAQKGAKF